MIHQFQRSLIFISFMLYSSALNLSCSGCHLGFSIDKKHKTFWGYIIRTISTFKNSILGRFFKFQPIRKHYTPSSHFEIRDERKIKNNVRSHPDTQVKLFPSLKDWTVKRWWMQTSLVKLSFHNNNNQWQYLKLTFGTGH